ncbi:MAG: PKD domain-containing protein, partial [Anaerolineales bacterium]|nr:PKD domain-containing protein [Anaerolineales bacterium]
GATVAAVNARLAATATDRGPAGVDNLWGAGVLDCRRAILPTANIGGPYNTPEGTDRMLNASASSDPDGDALTFSWDFNNDGVFGDAAGATPVFDRVGQDGVFPIAVRVSDPGGLTDTAAGVVVVTNVAPTVSLNSDAPRPENSVVTVLGQVSDPGWLDPLSAAILWGDGTPAEPVVGVLENVRPDATLTFAATHTYGDNGTFTASICASDDDVATCQSIALTIDNVAPAATLDTTGAFIINGQPTFVVEAGDPQAFSLRWQDPGSDDLTLTWDWDDGAPAPDVVTTSLVNPPAADPLPSPSLQPRDVIDAAVQTFSAPCLYQVGFSAADDDGGSAAGSVVVLVTGDDDEAEAAGIDDNSEAKERCYVKIIAYASQVFDEVHVLTKLDDDHPSGNEMLDEFDHVLVETWLKFATGEVGYGLAFDLDEDGVAEGTFGSLITAAEAVRLNPAATAAELRHQMKIMDHLSN